MPKGMTALYRSKNEDSDVATCKPRQQCPFRTRFCNEAAHMSLILSIYHSWSTWALCRLERPDTEVNHVLQAQTPDAEGITKKRQRCRA
jgi:hypothetical protein